MRKPRVLVCNEPRFLRELLAEAIAEEADASWLRESPSQGAIEQAAAAFLPDSVIVTLESVEGTPEICDVLFARYPELLIVAVAWPCNQALVFSYADGIRFAKIDNTLREVTNALQFEKFTLREPTVRLSREVDAG